MLQAVLDASGDDLLAVADEFRDQLTTLESHVLSNPSMSDVRHLHILSSQLLMLKSSITPFQYLLHALRSQDDMKAAAAAKPDGGSRGSVSYSGALYSRELTACLISRRAWPSAWDSCHTKPKLCVCPRERFLLSHL